jgi:hypothetical protein
MNRDSPLRHFHCHAMWPVIGIPDRGITLVIVIFSAAEFTLKFKSGEGLIGLLVFAGVEAVNSAAHGS